MNQELQEITPMRSGSSSEYIIIPVRSSIANHSPMQLTWDDLEYSVPSPSGEKLLLRSLSGMANPGEILCIMGPSGSGKTTLLNLLAGRQSFGKGHSFSGSIKVNGTETRDFKYTHFTAYVTQSDILLSTLTVREALMFSIDIRACLPLDEKQKRVEDMLYMMKIRHIANNIIGDQDNKGISGGERKRLCIGIEMIVNPAILILDEPTSGLDSVTAEVIVDLLKETAREGKTVLMTVHQPSAVIYSLIDKYILMSEGNIVYQGRREDAKRYFKELGFPCPHHTTPADHFMRILGVKNRLQKTPEEEERIEIITKAYTNADVVGRMTELKPVNEYNVINAPDTFQKFRYLLRRAFISVFRNKYLTVFKVVQTVFLFVLVDLLYHDVGTDFNSIPSRTGFLAIIMLTQTAPPVQNSVLIFFTERALYFKESLQGLYGPVSYYLCKTFSELPPLILSPVLFSLGTYWACDSNTEEPEKFPIFSNLYSVTCTIILHFNGAGIGYLGATVFKELLPAILASVMLLVLFMMYAGFFVNADSVPIWIDWIKYLSPFKYGYSILTINEFTDREVSCNQESCPDPLEFLGQDGNELWVQFVGLIAVTLAFRIFALMALMIKTRGYTG